MAESWSTRVARWKFNLFPAYRGTGGRVTFIRQDWGEVRIALPLSWRTRLTATFTFPAETVASIRAELERVPKLDRAFGGDLVDAEGVVHAEIEKVIHLRRRDGGS